MWIRKRYVLDKNSGKFAAPNGSIGHRWEQKGEWNLEKKDEDNGLNNLDPFYLTCMEDQLNPSYSSISVQKKMKYFNVIPIKKILKYLKNSYPVPNWIAVFSFYRAIL